MEGILFRADWKTCQGTLSVGMMMSSRTFAIEIGFPLPFAYHDRLIKIFLGGTYGCLRKEIEKGKKEK